MNPKRHDNRREVVRHGQSYEQRKAAQKPEPTQERPPVVDPAFSRERVNIPQREPVQPIRQTLRACLRCGRPLGGLFCGECGYRQTMADVRLLRFVDPERLQISAKKKDET